MIRLNESSVSQNLETLSTKDKIMEKKTVLTTWEKRVYDVWGNAEDGYDVNDSFSDGSIDIRCKIQRMNVVMPVQMQWVCAYPSDYQIGNIFGFSGKLEITGDDTVIYVNRESDGYPLGELRLTSHKSLSPIQE